MQINPSRQNFVKLAKDHNLIVLSYKFYSDNLTPVSAYYSLTKRLKGENFLLESMEGEEKISRFSFLGFVPIVSFKNKGKKIYVKDRKLRVFTTEKDPLFELKKIMRSFKVAPRENLRFFGGFVGYLGYDTVRFYEPIGKELPDTLKTFDSYFILPKFLIIFDHVNRQIELLSFVTINTKKNLQKVYLKEKKILGNILRNIITPLCLPLLSFNKVKKIKMKANMARRDFIAKVNKARQYIRQGEIIQTVLSQRFSTSFRGNPFDVYRYLRILNPSPYMFYLNFTEAKLAGSSPEMLLRCENGELITHPIAGTRKRGRNDKEQKQLEESLLNDPKERAEHIMLVDLARNDLGRIAVKKTVTVPIFMTVEHFSHVMHIVSEVRAKLRKDKDIFSALESCFPAGTLSGAPKVRAMQIINELEPTKRGIYGGSVGYFSFTNSLDTCIIIRTVLFKNNRAYIQVGAGIVADSKPEKEYNETINKAKAQFLALNLALKRG